MSRAEDLFAQALAITDPDTRGSFLRTECGEDHDLLVEVESLLAASDGSDSYFAGLAGRIGLPGGPEDAGTDPLIGAVVGHYRLISVLGQGGMAKVYLAERDDGAFERQVAVKIVRVGARADEMVERFARERQILAELDHPNIAGLFDGGVTSDGRPFLVMEYVEGQRITEYVVAHSLTVEARLELMLAVCEAVSHAHRSLVVHRDLKPSNILVSDDGAPKLLDFGIAKILTDEPDPDAPATRTDMRVLTPEYAAPEQLRGLPVTTQTDTYGLGLVLYELLAGRRPFDLKGLAPHEAERVLLTQDPSPPSKVSGATGRLVRDLDAVVLKALEKATQDRYGSVEALISDLEAARDARPMIAKTMGPAERTTRFVRRNWVPTSIVAGFAVMLTGWAVSSAVQRDRLEAALTLAEAERQAAVAERAVAEDVSSFVEGLFRSANQFSDRAERRDSIPVSVFLGDAEGRVREELADQPVVQARLIGLLGRYQRGLGNYEEAARLFEEALEEQRALHPGDHEDVAAGLSALSGAYLDLGRPAEGEALARESVDMRLRIDPEGNASMASQMANLASAIQNQGRLEEARPLYDSAIAMAERQPVPDSTSLLGMYNARGVLAFRLGDNDQAVEIFEKLVELQRTRLDAGHPALGREIQNLAFLKLSQGDAEGALTGFEEAMVILGGALGEEHPEVAATRGNLARALFRTGRADDAEREFVRSIEDRRSAGLGDIPSVANTLGHYAEMKIEQGELERALELYAEAEPIHVQAFGPAHPAIANVKAFRGMALCRLGQTDAGRASYRESLAMLERMLPPGHPQTESTRTAFAAECGDGDA